MTVIRAPELEIILPKSKFLYPMQGWCENQFGPRWTAFENRSGVWTVFWAGRENFGSYRWCFTNEKDLMLFVLRWS